MRKPFFTSSTISEGNLSYRLGQEATVTEDRRRFLENHGLTWDQTICMLCDHGETITVVDRATPVDAHRSIPGEVLITTDPTCTLMLLTADCLPVVFHDPVQHIIALGHFSRATIGNALPTKTITYLQQQFGTNAEDIYVMIGPHIHGTSYRFPLPLPERAPLIAPFITETGGYAAVNLLAATVSQLTGAGVPITHISTTAPDTGTDERFFSYYRTTHEGRVDGRFATITHLPH